MYDRLTVRMYHVGFGDCFLVRFWAGDQPFTILFDCGSITEGSDQVTKVADDVINSCKLADGTSRIDLLLATHRHKDHVGGFSNPLWAKVTVGEVWMPWTEDPSDPVATRIRTAQSSLALTLAGGRSDDYDPLATSPTRETIAKARERAELGIALNGLTNEKAMATLHNGFLGRPVRRFLPEKDLMFQERAIVAAPELRFHILGPPRDTAALKIMDPPNGMGYFRSGSGETSQTCVPAFGERWQISVEAFESQGMADRFRGDDRKAIDQSAEVPTGRLAAALDRAINNTSLIVMIELGDQMMLFPGDAQWGAWNAILEDPRGKALLARTTFYKVGHHGSHNATPREFIETIMPKGGVALFSTHAVKQWPDVPRAPLVQAIAGKASKWARSDDETTANNAGFKVETNLYIEWEEALA